MSSWNDFLKDKKDADGDYWYWEKVFTVSIDVFMHLYVFFSSIIYLFCVGRLSNRGI